ncbi:MAG: CHAT domain-containing protein [Symploca sp. SIO1B1]|nr:CHAT domain-containing protein [Symploca sp. SIO1B1]
MSSNPPVKILFLAADPSDAARLRLQQEYRDIEEKLKLSEQRGFLLELRLAVRTKDIIQILLDTKPQIVHFSGHGQQSGNLCFEDEIGKSKPVEPEALGSLFKLLAKANQVNCVILNACYSEKQAHEIVKYIPFVIGMNRSISDKAAIAFAVGFYSALGAQESVEEAYEYGCAQIRLEGCPEHLTPVFLTKKKVTNASQGDAPNEDIENQLQGISRDANQARKAQSLEKFEVAKQLWMQVLSRASALRIESSAFVTEAEKSLQEIAQLQTERSNERYSAPHQYLNFANNSESIASRLRSEASTKKTKPVRQGLARLGWVVAGICSTVVALNILDLSEVSVSDNPQNEDIVSESPQQTSINFICTTINDTPVTLAKSDKWGGDTRQFIRWVSDYGNSAGYTPALRCQEVTAKLNKYFAGGGRYITYGVKNQQKVICLTDKKGNGCIEDLFTLRPDEDSKAALEDLFSLNAQNFAGRPLRM